MEVMLPLVLVYCPATFPNTSTEMVQLAFAESVAPLRLIVEVPSVAVVVPPVREPDVQEGAVNPLGVAINSPVGNTSEKPTPVNAAVPGFARVNRKVLVPPWIIGFVKKLFERVGSVRTGFAQPETTTSSRYTVEADLLAPTALMRNADVAVPVDAAVMVPEANQFPLEAAMVERVEYAAPFALE